MLIKVLIGFLVVAGAAAVLVLFLRQKFLSQLDAFEEQLRNGPASPVLRTDPPPEVFALARRLGARGEVPSRYVSFDQSGAMWQSPGARKMHFAASQTIATGVSGFVWSASPHLSSSPL